MSESPQGSLVTDLIDRLSRKAIPQGASQEQIETLVKRVAGKAAEIRSQKQAVVASDPDPCQTYQDIYDAALGVYNSLLVQMAIAEVLLEVAREALDECRMNPPV